MKNIDTDNHFINWLFKEGPLVAQNFFPFYTWKLKYRLCEKKREEKVMVPKQKDANESDVKKLIQNKEQNCKKFGEQRS